MVEGSTAYTNIFIVQGVEGGGEVVGGEGDRCGESVSGDGENHINVIVVEVGFAEEGVKEGCLIILVFDVAFTEHLQGYDNLGAGGKISADGFCGLDSVFQVFLLGFQLQHSVPGGGGKDTGFDGLYQICNAAFGFGQKIPKRFQFQNGVI